MALYLRTNCSTPRPMVRETLQCLHFPSSNGMPVQLIPQHYHTTLGFQPLRWTQRSSTRIPPSRAQYWPTRRQGKNCPRSKPRVDSVEASRRSFDTITRFPPSSTNPDVNEPHQGHSSGGYVWRGKWEQGREWHFRYRRRGLAGRSTSGGERDREIVLEVVRVDADGVGGEGVEEGGVHAVCGQAKVVSAAEIQTLAQIFDFDIHGQRFQELRV